MKTDHTLTRVAYRVTILTAALLGVLATASGSRAAQPVTGPELILWLDAQDVDGDGDRGNEPADGQSIARWIDKSGCGNHATQDELARQPKCWVSKANSGPSFVHFTAVRGEFLSAGNARSLNLEQMTAFVVARAEPSSTNMWLLGKNVFGSSWTGYGVAVQQGTLTPWPHLGLGGSTAQENGYFSYDRSIGGGPAIVEIACGANRLYGLLNGQVERAQISAGRIQANDRNLLIGASPQNPPACEFLQGDIAEILIYGLPLSDQQRLRTRTYLAEKYQVPLADSDQRMVVIENGYLPVVVDNPITPPTRTLSAQEATELTQRDWRFQAMGTPLMQRSLAEIQWARQLADRLANTPQPPDVNSELAELSRLEQRLKTETNSAEDAAAGDALHFAVRRVKRQIMFKNPSLDFSRLLLIDQPYPQGPEWQHEAVHRMGHRAIPGGRLLLLEGLHPGGQVQQLAPDRPGSFWRPELSFDGQRVLFCYKAHDDKSFHLYEINVDGTAPRQLTDGPYDDIDPIYLPDGRIMFTTTRGNTYVRCGPYIYSYVLARCDADGSHVYLISTNSEPDFVPALLNDGRVAYSRWEYSDKDQNRVQSLWTTNQNGTGTAVLWGNQSVWPDHLAEPRPLPHSNRVMFTAVGHHDWFHGAIGIIDPRQGTDFPAGLTRVTWDFPWAEVGNSPLDQSESPHYHASGNYTGYLGAYPLSAEDFLVSARGLDDKFRIYLMDVHGNRELIYEGAYNAWYAIPVRSRPIPPRHPDDVRWPGTGHDRRPVEPGVFYSADVYEGVPELPRGIVKYLRVFQQDAKTYSTWEKIFVYSGPPISAVQAEAVKRIVSTVPVEADGSVYFEAPAGQSLFFQLLDEHYRAVHTMRSFTGVLPGERRGCVGCHKMHSTAPPPAFGLASRRAATQLTPPAWGSESIGYERFVQPVLERHCCNCHNGTGETSAPPNLTLRPGSGLFQSHIFQEPYLTLIGPAAWPVPVPTQGQPGYGIAGAIPVYDLRPEDMYAHHPASDLPSTIHRTLRPMRYLSYRSRLVELAMSGRHYDVQVDPLELQRLIAWVDANCPYLGEEELRAMDDPEFVGIEQLPIRPRVKTAPIIIRP